MNSINLKDEVRKAIATEWSAFAANHPNLAAAIDQTLLVEQATASLADDPEYQQAIADADATALAGGAAVDLIARLVGRFLAKIV